MSEQRVTSLSKNTGAAALQGTCNRQVCVGQVTAWHTPAPGGWRGRQFMAVQEEVKHFWKRNSF